MTALPITTDPADSAPCAAPDDADAPIFDPAVYAVVGEDGLPIVYDGPTVPAGALAELVRRAEAAATAIALAYGSTETTLYRDLRRAIAGAQMVLRRPLMAGRT